MSWEVLHPNQGNICSNLPEIMLASCSVSWSLCTCSQFPHTHLPVFPLGRQFSCFHGDKPFILLEKDFTLLGRFPF